MYYVNCKHVLVVYMILKMMQLYKLLKYLQLYIQYIGGVMMSNCVQSHFGTSVDTA